MGQHRRQLEYVLSTNLLICNVGSEPTFVTRARKEVLDITLCSREAADMVFDWRVKDYILTSDHKCISFHLSLDPLPPILFRNPASTNWLKFSELIAKGTRVCLRRNEVPTCAVELDNLAESVQSLMVDAYEEACPCRVHKAGKSVPYYTSEDRDRRKKVRVTFNRCKITKQWDQYYDELRLYSKMLRVGQRTGWSDQCASTSSVHDSAKMY